MQQQKIFVYDAPWKPCTEAEKNRLYDEILLEIDPENHPLAGFHFDVMAQNESNDVLVLIENSEFDYAVLHLTWSGNTEKGDLPYTAFFISMEEWRSRMKETS